MQWLNSVKELSHFLLLPHFSQHFTVDEFFLIIEPLYKYFYPVAQPEITVIVHCVIRTKYIGHVIA